jgi:predicted nuclease of predicted toxin-antitoxin system
MRFLIDMPVSPRTASWLIDLGHDAVHALDLGLGCAPDSALLERAAREQRVVITADTDFPQLLALSGSTMPGVILLRGGAYTRQETEGLLARVLDAVSESVLMRSICVVDRGRVRCRALPLR